MDRRKFLKSTAFLSTFFGISSLAKAERNQEFILGKKKAKNIIFMVSDGMSLGTLTMANLYSERILGKTTEWIKLYQTQKVNRALMDTASLSSLVTDSAAASSAFGGGFRVRNGVLNIGENGEKHLPIWQKFKQKGKKAGCVTTVTITHATPAGFCVNSDKRNAEEDIAQMYAEIGFDVMMGGGDEFFNPQKRTDKKDIYQFYKHKGYQILKNKKDFSKVDKNKPILGVFNHGALPYCIDKNYNSKEFEKIPTLAEMTTLAIEQMKNHKEGFVLQVESGKVDWAAHANDIGALIQEQLAFDDAIKVALDFAQKDKETLVIITTDHGNANPGIIYGKQVDKGFDAISNYRYSNETFLNEITPSFHFREVKDLAFSANKIQLSDDEAKQILTFYNGIEKEDGLYNYKKVPFKLYAQMQGKRNFVGWIGMDHSGDYVEVATFGVGQELLKPFVKNIDLHYLMLNAAGIENKF